MSHLGRTLAAWSPTILLVALAWSATPAHAADQGCVAQAEDVAGCQPAPFDPPLAQMPTTRVGADGTVNHKASEADVRKGVKLLEQKLGLFRNFVDVHWVPLVPSKKDEATGNSAEGDLDDQGDARGLTISGKCLFAGHGNFAHGGQDTNPLEIFRIQDDPVRNAPVKVGEIPTPGPGFDDTVLGASLYKKADGKDAIILVRDMDTSKGKGDGRLYLYAVNPADCKVEGTSQPLLFGGDFHEFSSWHDPSNPKRILIVTSAYGGAGLPDPNKDGHLTPDLRVVAVTDEDTGEMLPKPVTLATFTLQDVGGPVRDERPDATGLFSDGRYPDYSNMKDGFGRPIPPMKMENHYIHQETFSTDGERIYVAGAMSGFYILNSEAIAHHRNADLAAGKAGCNQDATNVYEGGLVGKAIVPAKLATVENDCVHMIVNDDPGVKALVAAGNVGRYLSLQDHSRWDPYPPVQGATGIHSAIVVPDRPSLDKNNTKGRPALVVLSEERGGCPTSSMFVLQVESEISPMIIGTFGVNFNDVTRCIDQPTTEPNGEPRKKVAWQAHNPTVFKNLVFLSWYGQGLRAIDISNPRNPREVGHANTVPVGMARSYPIYKDGLFYWTDTGTGLHVARYTGPRADELPKDGKVYEGNAIPHE